tara:strand:+ start:6845 stop:7543 length:699 start_codon:yes stop_codon:yes gene_type:complete
MNYKKNKKMFWNFSQDHWKDEPDMFYASYVIPEQIQRGVAIDLGSNIGMFCKENYTTFDEIYAIEANYTNFLETQNQCRLNKMHNVKCFNLAASKNSGEIIKIYRNGNDSVSSTTSDALLRELNKHNERRQPENQAFHNVMSISLEGMFDFFDLNYVDYMKIDIEGAEYDFLLNKDLSNIVSMGIEIHGTFGKEKKDELKNYLSKYFRIYDVKYDDESPGHSVITYINKNIS